MGDALPRHNVGAAAKDCLATVYLKHRSLQNRKVTYRGWHLPSAGKSRMVDELCLSEEVYYLSSGERQQ